MIHDEAEKWTRRSALEEAAFIERIVTNALRRTRCTARRQCAMMRRRRWALSVSWRNLMFFRKHIWRYRSVRAWRRVYWERGATRREQMRKVEWLKQTAWIRAEGWILDGGGYPVSGPQR